MRAALYIGEEATALGYRLAGLGIAVCKPEEAAARLAEARGQVDLVLVGAGAARGIPPRVLAEAQSSRSPLILVVPDVTGEEPAGFAAAVNRAFGLES